MSFPVPDEVTSKDDNSYTNTVCHRHKGRVTRSQIIITINIILFIADISEVFPIAVFTENNTVLLHNIIIYYLTLK